jgi:hypothetical protein
MHTPQDQGDSDPEVSWSTRLIEAMLSSLPVPSKVAVLQAWRNAEARASLVREFGALTGHQVADLAGSRAVNRAALASRWKSNGRIFSVDFRGTTLYPAFQFDHKGQPRPVIARIVRVLGCRGSEWQLALWLTSSVGWLNGQRPVDLLETDPEAVAEAADREAEELVF